MTSILSSISGRFSFSLLLGTFVPAFVFILLARMLVVPLVPGALDVALLTPLKAIDESWEIFAILLSAIVLSGLLYSLNTPLIRIYEGYPWQDTWLGTQSGCGDNPGRGGRRRRPRVGGGTGDHR